MSQIGSEALRDVHAAFDKYVALVQQSAMEESAKKTYLVHAYNFVRWLGDDFTPGARLASERDTRGGSSE